MKIALDSKRLFNNPTGLGNYSRTIAHNFLKFIPEADLYLCVPKIKKNRLNEQFLEDKRYKIIQKPKKTPFWRSYFILNDLKKQKIDLYHGLSNEIPLTIHHSGIKSVVTIHDLIFKIYPSTYKFIDRWIYDFKFKYACKHADKIIAISAATKQDIIKYYKIAPEKIEVVYQACLDIFYENQEDTTAELAFKNLALPSNYMVFVGSVIPRKNVLQLLQAYKDIPQQQKIPLVIVGKGGEYYQKCIDFVSENHLQEYVIFKNNIHSNAVLKLVYQHAILSVYPSVYEGFGLPVVESLLCGTPVITSSVSSMPEAGGNGALYSAPNDLASLTENMQKLLANEDLRKQLVQNGRQHIQQNFNREKLSKQLNTIYQNLLNR